MIDIGVATSVARDNSFSWDDTVDFTLFHKLNSIQFYVPQNKILTKIPDHKYFKNIYLHLPIEYDLNTDELLVFASNFKTYFNSNKLIIHQKESLSLQETFEIIEKYNNAGFFVGIENEGSQDINSYFDLINFLSWQKCKFFVVPDIHRFYFNFALKHDESIIYKKIIKIFKYCNNSDIKIILHVIDSMSFKSNRNDWIPIFEGIVPYSRLFKFISNHHINIESLIFEYENYDHVTNSLENIKKFDYNTGKY